MNCEQCDKQLMLESISHEATKDIMQVVLICRGGGHRISRFVRREYNSWMQQIHHKAEQLRRVMIGGIPGLAPAFAAGIGEILADVAMLVALPEGERPANPEPEEPKSWIADPITIYFDGSCHPNPGPAGWGFIVYDEEGTTLDEVSVPSPTKITNNAAEYSALMEALQWAVNHRMCNIKICGDSEVVIKQMLGQYKVGEKLQTYHGCAQALANKVLENEGAILTFEHISGDSNPAHHLAEEAYKMARRAKP